jgi:hypothetical protein
VIDLEKYKNRNDYPQADRLSLRKGGPFIVLWTPKKIKKKILFFFFFFSCLASRRVICSLPPPPRPSDRGGCPFVFSDYSQTFTFVSFRYKRFKTPGLELECLENRKKGRGGSVTTPIRTPKEAGEGQKNLFLLALLRIDAAAGGFRQLLQLPPDHRRGGGGATKRAALSQGGLSLINLSLPP